MKRLSVLLSLALVMALSVGAFAALNTHIGGYLETDFTLRREDPEDPESPFKLYAAGRSKVELHMRSGGRAGNLEAIIHMDSAVARSANQGDEWEWWQWRDFSRGLSGEGEGGRGIPFRISGYELIAEGALWKDGTPLRINMGTFRPTFNHYTAFELGERGVEITGAKIGPIALSGYYGFYNPDGKLTSVGAVKASGSIDVIDFNATLTNVGEETADADRFTNYTVDATVRPVDGLRLYGVYSYDAEHEGTSMKAEATLETIPNMTITGTIRRTEPEDKFNPRFKDGDADRRGWWNNEKYYRVGVNTNQSGVELSGSYELKHQFTNDKYQWTALFGSAKTTVDRFNVGGEVKVENTTEDGVNTDKKTTTKLTASTTVADVNLGYTATFETTDKTTMKNDITASTTVDLPFADGVFVEGIVRTGYTEKKTDFGVRAEYHAPNGFKLEAGYANFYWRHNWDGNYPNFVRDKENGFYVRAGARVDFW